MAANEKKIIDWERIECDYRAGILSLREIAASHPGTSHMAIARKAKAQGWTRDLSAKIKAKAEELVTRRAVTKTVTEEQAVTERQVIEAGAEAIASVRLAHRGDIRRARTLAISLLAELEIETGDRELFQDLGELLRKEDAAGRDRLNDIYHKVISSAGRIDSMKKLSDTLKTLIGLEREAYGLNSDPGSGDNQTPAGLNYFYGDTETNP